MKIKVSIITAILNSQEIVRRQFLYYSKFLPGDVEVIYVDDGSEPPLDFYCVEKKFKFQGYATNDKRPWTQPKARNYGARRANGDYLICTDIDHIISPEVIEAARNPIADVIRLRREAGVLDENGNFTQDEKILRKWGLQDRYFKRHLRLPPHGNSYIFKTSLYLGLGGVDERFCGTGRYPNREEVTLKRKLKPLVKDGRVTIIDDDRRPLFYMMPNGKYCDDGNKDFNPFNLFHNLSREFNIGRLTNKQKRKLKAAEKARKNG